MLPNPVDERIVEERRAAYNALLQSLGPATHDEIAAALAARDPVEPEPELTPDVVERIRAKIAGRAGLSSARP